MRSGIICVRHIKIVLLAVLLAAGIGAMAPRTAHADIIYHWPRINGISLDHCWYWTRNCGWARAHWWCRRRGHPGARAYRLTRPGRTFVVGSRQICRGAGCVGYRYIRCVGSAYGRGGYGPGPGYARRRVRFNYPRINGAIVDHCVWFATRCGWPAANLYCRRRGFSRAIYWSRFRPGRTWVQRSRRYCVGYGCVGFQRITCIR